MIFKYAGRFFFSGRRCLEEETTIKKKKKYQLRELMIHVFVYKLFVRREKRVDLLEREPANKRKGIGVKSLQVFSESY